MLQLQKTHLLCKCHTQMEHHGRRMSHNGVSAILRTRTCVRTNVTRTAYAPNLSASKLCPQPIYPRICLKHPQARKCTATIRTQSIHQVRQQWEEFSEVRDMSWDPLPFQIKKQPDNAHHVHKQQQPDKARTRIRNYLFILLIKIVPQLSSYTITIFTQCSK
jgi:hypothetical protein